MIYTLTFSETAKSDIEYLKRAEPKAYEKLITLLEELREHPMTGICKPKLLSKNRKGQWSRRINKKHRLIYEIKGSIICVYILSARGHYDDK